MDANRRTKRTVEWISRIVKVNVSVKVRAAYGCGKIHLKAYTVLYEDGNITNCTGETDRDSTITASLWIYAGASSKVVTKGDRGYSGVQRQNSAFPECMQEIGVWEGVGSGGGRCKDRGAGVKVEMEGKGGVEGWTEGSEVDSGKGSDSKVVCKLSFVLLWLLYFVTLNGCKIIVSFLLSIDVADNVSIFFDVKSNAFT